MLKEIRITSQPVTAWKEKIILGYTRNTTAENFSRSSLNMAKINLKCVKNKTGGTGKDLLLAVWVRDRVTCITCDKKASGVLKFDRVGRNISKHKTAARKLHK